MAEGGAQGSGFRSRVEAALERVRPAIQFDGGDIELLDVAGNNATVRLVGACVG